MTSVVSTNPYRPAEVVGEFGEVTPAELPAVFARARSARQAWGSLAATQRAQALHSAAAELDQQRDRIVDLVVREVGKPVSEARGEVQRGIDILRYHAASILMPDGETLAASTSTGLQFTRRRPLGTVAVVTPWNFPVAIPLWKLVPALAWGNAVVLKPSSAAVSTAAAITEILSAHLPADLLQSTPGEAVLVRALLAADDVHGVSFTGSTSVGLQLVRQAAQRPNPIPCQAEMGGSNPSVVLADADLDAAASAVAASAMGFAGQKCTATSRIIVEDPVYDTFRDRLVAAVEALPVGNPAIVSTVAGPLISDNARDHALTAVKASTGTTLTGGHALETGATMELTLVEVKAPDDILLSEEVFAPVAALTRASDPADALRRATDTVFGLSAGLFTTNLQRTLDFINTAEAGMLRINAPTTGVDYWTPFGGMKSSSYGTREQGLAARDFYTHGLTVFIDR